MSHKSLKQEAMESIGELFSDTSVSKEVTLDSMQELAEIVAENIQMLEFDIRKEAHDHPPS